MLPVTLSCNCTCWIIRTTNHFFLWLEFLHLFSSSLPVTTRQFHPSLQLLLSSRWAPPQCRSTDREGRAREGESAQQGAFSSMIFKELSHQRHEAALLLHSPLAPCQSTCSHMHTEATFSVFPSLNRPAFFLAAELHFRQRVAIARRTHWTWRVSPHPPLFISSLRWPVAAGEDILEWWANKYLCTQRQLQFNTSSLVLKLCLGKSSRTLTGSFPAFVTIVTVYSVIEGVCVCVCNRDVCYFRTMAQKASGILFASTLCPRSLWLHNFLSYRMQILNSFSEEGSLSFARWHKRDHTLTAVWLLSRALLLFSRSRPVGRRGVLPRQWFGRQSRSLTSNPKC